METPCSDQTIKMEVNAEPKPIHTTEAHLEPPTEAEPLNLNPSHEGEDATLMEPYCEPACEVEEGITEPTKHTGITEIHPMPPMEFEPHDADFSAAVNAPSAATLIETCCEPPPYVESAAPECTVQAPCSDQTIKMELNTEPKPTSTTHTDDPISGESSDDASFQTAPEDTQMETCSETLNVAPAPELQEISQNSNCENTDVDTPTSPVEKAVSLPEESGAVKEEEKGSTEVAMSVVEESTPQQEGRLDSFAQNL